MSEFFDDNTPEVDTPEQSILNQLNDQSARFARLIVAVEQQRMALQTAELTLATRIADVDDEQQRIVSQLAKKQAANEAQFKRTRVILIGVFSALALVITAALAAFYVQFVQTQQRWNDDIAELRDMTNTLQHQPPDSAIQNQVIQERLQELSSAVAALSSPPAATGVTEAAAESSAASSPAPAIKPGAKVETLGQLTLEPETPIKAPVTHSAATSAAPKSTHSSPRKVNVAAAEQIPVNDRVYSLQLIGFFSFEELLTYTQRTPLPEKVFFQTETYHGRPWFVLIHSLHSNYASAKATIANFPPELAQLDVWIRKLPADATVNLLNITPAPAQ